MTESFAYLNGELINLYTKENPILEAGDECFGLMFNIEDFHRPIIIRGIIVEDKFVDGMNKQYYVKILEILESPNSLNEFVNGRTFIFYSIENEVIVNKAKNVLITKKTNFNNYVVKLESYYVRNSKEQIKKLRNEYIRVVRTDVEKMLKDIQDIETSEIL